MIRYTIAALVLAALVVSVGLNNAFAEDALTKVKAKGRIASVNPGTSGMGTGSFIWLLDGKWKLIADENLAKAKFYAEFDMMNYDGTHKHIMALDDFKTTSVSIEEGNVVIEGTLDILGGHSEDELNIIPNGDDVQVIISILNNNAIMIQVDHPHFGGMDTPIYGNVKIIRYA